MWISLRTWTAGFAGSGRRDWLGGGSVTSGELERSREVRESLRALLVQNAGGDGPSLAQLEPLIALGTASSLQPNVGDDGRVNLEADVGAASVRLGSLLLIVRDAQRDGSWDRLKACRNDECLWAFYDRSHAGRGAWCDMASCGNKIKNRNLRARRGVSVVVVTAQEGPVLRTVVRPG